MQFLIGEKHGFTVGELSSYLNVTNDIGCRSLFYPKYHESVIEQNFISGTHFFGEVGIRHSDSVFISYNILRGKTKG